MQGWGQEGETMFWLRDEVQIGQSYCSLREEVRRQAGLHVRECLPHALSLWLQPPRVHRPQQKEMGGLGTVLSQSVPLHTPYLEQPSLGSSRSHKHMGMARAPSLCQMVLQTWSSPDQASALLLSLGSSLPWHDAPQYMVTPLCMPWLLSQSPHLHRLHVPARCHRCAAIAATSQTPSPSFLPPPP